MHSAPRQEPYGDRWAICKQGFLAKGDQSKQAEVRGVYFHEPERSGRVFRLPSLKHYETKINSGVIYA